ncbi:hypothetical protein SM124_05650 [Bacillus sp. 31A1R]|uniref:Uncharacterized protein n=1 Tax=Robertmurraya mangrovi TaxID=3098077 RepID=A0ABU5IVR2_9BACI|nr:hypothetical protein [Bacillus sp. 31A1R]MDZ5471225.1 hypothetical protein [Bacillus sp. 31A1R]
MTVAIISVIVIFILSAIFTLWLAGKSDREYRKSSKKNTINLTLIYVVTIGLSLVALAVYIRWYS